ncbi:MAG: sulfatase, partial [Planctomycetota bacterium]
DLVLITVDTLRVDRLDLYGAERQTSPGLTALAASGITFERAISQAPWTLPAMASIHTSLFPGQHGAIQVNRRLGQKAVTVAEVLAQNGYRTAAVVSHLFCSRRFGFGQGFERFDQTLLATEKDMTSERLTRAALKSYGLSGEGPRFLWVHYFDPHFSYLRHPEYGYADGYEGPLSDEVKFEDLGGLEGPAPGQISAEDARYALAVYDEEIRHTDRWIAELVEGIRDAASGREVVFVLTSDHGEYFFERGRFGHGKDVYKELVHVPLILAGDLPGGERGVRVERFVETASIPATLMELAGISGHPFRGISLLSGDDPRQASGGAVYSEGNYAWGTDQRKRAVIVDPWKLIENLDDGSLELYEVRQDPEELIDRIEDERVGAIVERLSALLRSFSERNTSGPADQIIVSEEERRRMEALGYTSGGK